MVRGGGDNDRLFGGKGRDIFEFTVIDNGNDVIVDFQDGIDRIRIDGRKLDFDDLGVYEVSRGARFYFNGEFGPSGKGLRELDVSVLLRNVDEDDLSAYDFIFG